MRNCFHSTFKCMLAKQNNTHVPKKTTDHIISDPTIFFHCICGNSPDTTMPQINSHSSNIASHNRTTANNPIIIQMGLTTPTGLKYFGPAVSVEEAGSDYFLATVFDAKLRNHKFVRIPSTYGFCPVSPVFFLHLVHQGSRFPFITSCGGSALFMYPPGS